MSSFCLRTGLEIVTVTVTTSGHMASQILGLADKNELRYTAKWI